MPDDASKLFARNVLSLLLSIAKDGQVKLDLADEVIAGDAAHPRRRGPPPAHRGGVGGRSRSMTKLDPWSMLFVFMLATFVGLEVIRGVSRLLHTPLMSLTNAISAIAIVGSIIIAGEQKDTMSAGPRRDRRRRVDDQHRQRLPDHRPHAEDVQGARRRRAGGARLPAAGDEGASGRDVAASTWIAGQLPRRRGALHPLAASG